MEYPPNSGGVGRYLATIVNNWTEKEAIEVKAATFFKFIWPKWLKSLSEPFKIKPSELWISHILPLGYVALIYKILTGTPYTIFTHGTDLQFADKYWHKRFLSGIILNQARQIIANSRYTMSLVEAFGIKNKSRALVYPCPALNSSPSISAKKPASLLSVGRLVTRKGFDAGIRAVMELKKTIPNINYTIIGSGAEEENLKKLIEDNGAQDYIFIITNADDNTLKDFYAKSEVLLAPGREISGDVEGFGLVILEAAQFGTPAVATNIGGVEETIINNKTGILIPDNHPKTIAATINKLFKDNEWRQQLGRAAKERVGHEFNINEQIKKLTG